MTEATPTTLLRPTGEVVLGPAPAVRLSDGRLALRTPHEPDPAALGDVVVDGVPGTAELVRSGRWHAEACDRLDRAAGRRWWRCRRRIQDAPVVLVRLLAGGSSGEE